MASDQVRQESGREGPAGPAILSEAETDAIKTAIEARLDRYIDAARRRDIDWFLEFWADVDEFVIAGDGDLKDRAAWEQQLRQAVADTKEILDFEFFNRHTFVLGPDTAAHTTQFRWAYETNSGDILKSHGSWTYVFKNFDGAWRVVHSGGTHVFD